MCFTACFTLSCAWSRSGDVRHFDQSWPSSHHCFVSHLRPHMVKNIHIILGRSGILSPLLKPGKSPKAAEYSRPACSTRCIVKVLKKIMQQRLQFWREKYTAFPNHVSRFRPGRSTMDLVLDLVSHVEQEGASENFTAVIFLDVRRAFDTVSHIYAA